MRTYRYLHYDVFTDAPFEGNQLAVFPEPAGLSTGEMQTITREMNFSECTFIFPPETPGTDVRMRIFTPGEELPMAGHPTIGSTFALVKEGVIKPGQDGFVFGLGVGPTPVSLEWKGSALDFAWMTQKNPEFGAEIDGPRGLRARDRRAKPLDLADAPVQPVSCGVPFLFAALTSRAAVDSVSVDQTAYALGVQGRWHRARCRSSSLRPTAADHRETKPCTVACSRPASASARIPPLAARADRSAATCSSTASLPRERLAHIVSLQGVKMLRPSRIHISIDSREDEIRRVRVGGRSVLVGDGRVTF